MNKRIRKISFWVFILCLTMIISMINIGADTKEPEANDTEESVSNNTDNLQQDDDIATSPIISQVMYSSFTKAIESNFGNVHSIYSSEDTIGDADDLFLTGMVMKIEMLMKWLLHMIPH